MATFGYTTIGGTSSANGGEFVLVSKETLSENAAISKLTTYVDGVTNGAESIRAVIYSNVGGVPTALIGAGTTTSIDVNAPAAWKDLPLGSPVNLVPDVYWIGFHFGGGAVAFHRFSDFAAANLHFQSQAFSSGPPDPFVSGGTVDERMSVYGTYPDAVTQVLSMQSHVFGHNMW